MRPLPSTPYNRLIKNRDYLLNTMKECVQKRIDNQQLMRNDSSFLQFLMDEAGPEHAYQYAYLSLGIILATRTNTGNFLKHKVIYSECICMVIVSYHKDAFYYGQNSR